MQLFSMNKKKLSVFCWRQGQGPEQPDSKVKVCGALHRAWKTSPSDVPSKLNYDSKPNKISQFGPVLFTGTESMQSKINN